MTNNKSETDRIRLAGPRLAIKVAELFKAVARQGDSDFNQKEIADRLGVSESRISQIINGDGNVRIATLARFFEAAGLTADVLVTDENGRPVEILSRRSAKPRKRVQTGSYTHQVVTDDGDLKRVYSYSAVPHAGKPVDFPLETSPSWSTKTEVRRTEHESKEWDLVLRR